ncbi:hypothetical protein UA45_22700 [Morganella morganii]|uniref:Uncharacterized protein n=1 Tax=Morganella morganii TaxID=582 RepID=A0A0D8L3Z0_MORMO|nr:hypothetical protein UA45_22700 [Morganella morganii]
MIIHGSGNVNIKGKPAARAAGKIPGEKLTELILADTKNLPASKGRQIAGETLKKAFMLTPQGWG